MNVQLLRVQISRKMTKPRNQNHMADQRIVHAKLVEDGKPAVFIPSAR